METPRPSTANPSGPANPSAASPHPGPGIPGAAHESTAASSVPPGTSELRSPEAGSPTVAVVPPPHERGEPTAPLQQPLIPVLQSPTAQPTPEPTTAVAARPPTGSTLQEQLSSPTRPPLQNPTMAHSTSTGHHGSTEKLEDADSFSGMGFPELHRDSAIRTNHPLPVPPQARLVDNGNIPSHRQRALNYDPVSLRPRAGSRRSNVDWIVPVDEKGKPTVNQRLQPTLDVAVAKRDMFASRAKYNSWALNIAIGLQVLFGSITTGLSAVATGTGSGHSTATGTTILGALSTLLASYLAKARGSQEPELSVIRVRDLEHFIREIRAFMLDHGHVDTNEWDGRIERFRKELEEIIVHSNGGLKSGPSP